MISNYCHLYYGDRMGKVKTVGKRNKHEQMKDASKILV
jgi:hypothetical protein